MSISKSQQTEQFNNYAAQAKAEDKSKADSSNAKRTEKLKTANKAKELLNRVKSGDAPQKQITTTKASAANDAPVYFNLAEYQRLIEDGLYASVIHQWRQALDLIVNNLEDDYSFTKNQINALIIPLLVADTSHPLPEGAKDVWCRSNHIGYKQDLMEPWAKYSAWSFGLSMCVSSQDESDNAKLKAQCEQIEKDTGKKVPFNPKNVIGKYALFSTDPKVNDDYLAAK